MDVWHSNASDGSFARAADKWLHLKMIVLTEGVKWKTKQKLKASFSSAHVCVPRFEIHTFRSCVCVFFSSSLGYFT